jgi:hypothetical protein
VKNLKDEMRAKGYLPAPEVAAKLGYSTQTLRNWVAEERVHGVLLGRRSLWVEWGSVLKYFKKAYPEAAKLVGLA